jgi:hypothetical protein
MPHPTPAVRAVAAALETLESRTLLSVSVTLKGDTLTIIGDDKANDISAVQQESTLVVKTNGKTRKFSADDIDKLVIDAKGGNDRVLFERTDDIDDVRVDGGSGNDDIEINVAHLPDGSDDALHFNADVRGGSGNDNFDIDVDTNDSPGDTNAGVPDDDHDNGNGDENDNEDAKLAINFKLDGDSGNDTIDAQVDLNGGDDGEVVANIDAGSGDDEVDFGVAGADDEDDAADDDADDNGAPDDNDDDTDDAGDTADHEEVDVDVNALITAGSGTNDVDVQLGTEADAEHNTGDVALDVRGGSGKDELEASLGFDINASDNRPSVRISGGSDDDRLGLTVVGNVDYRKLKGVFRIDGGSGTDAYATNAPGSALKLASVERPVSSV